MADAAYPFAAPVVSGSNITVDLMLQQPTRITRYLADMSLKNYFTPLVFPTTGSVTGGAVIYDQITLNDAFGTRDVQDVGPGDEFPIITAGDPTPKVAVPVKFGGKFFVTDEARDRNDPGTIQREGRKLLNMIVRRSDARTVALLDASIAATPGQVVTGNNWNTVVTAGVSASSAAAWPIADFAKAQLVADIAELGYEYKLWLVNPAQKAQFDLVYGTGARDVLASHGVTMVASNRVPAGTAYAVADGGAGETRLEKPLSTETWREPETQRTWVQSDIRPVSFMTDPFAVVKVQGLAG